MCSCLSLQIPGTDVFIRPDSVVKLGRFDKQTWIVQHGWFSFGGNRPFCGWYFVNSEDATVKPLQQPDLADIYLVEAPSMKGDCC